jgi:hypothetical protein
MPKPPVDAKALAFLAVALVVGIAVVSRLRRKTWTDHDVSDPGVTL